MDLPHGGHGGAEDSKIEASYSNRNHNTKDAGVARAHVSCFRKLIGWWVVADPLSFWIVQALSCAAHG